MRRGGGAAVPRVRLASRSMVILVAYSRISASRIFALVPHTTWHISGISHHIGLSDHTHRDAAQCIAAQPSATQRNLAHRSASQRVEHGA